MISGYRGLCVDPEGNMNGIQIEHILNLVEESSAFNRQFIRREVADYLRTNMQVVVDALATKGETVIPTSYGGIKLTTEDLDLAIA